MKNQAKQRGTAIIIALFVTALVAAMAVAMLDHLRTDIRRTELLLNNDQADLYAQGSVAWAISQLTHNLQQQKPDKLVDNLPIKSSVNIENGATIYSIISDEQSKLNLNNVSDGIFQDALARLIQSVKPAIGASTVHTITAAVATHKAMTSISELRIMQGMTAELFNRLAPFVTALPEKTFLNVNSIAIPVIMSLSPSISLEVAKAFVVYRKTTPLTDLSHLGNFDMMKNNPIGQGSLTLTSDYFLVETHVIIGDQQATTYTLLKRLLKDSKPTVLVLWQSKGAL